MTDYDLPDLPSDEELGITEEDRKEYEQEGEGAGAGGKASKKRKATKRGKPSGGSGAGEGDGTGAGDGGGGPPSGGPAPLEPAPTWRGPVTLLLLFALSLFASSRTGQVGEAAANAAESEFSSARAMSLLVDIARDAHPPGSPEHARVRGLLVERLRDLGLEAEIQTTTSLLERGGRIAGDPASARAATVRNIVARIPGSNPSGAVLVTAHYDSRGIAVGAGDDGSGVVTIVEAVRALLTGPAPRNDIIVLLTDAEELGLLGARAFVDEHPWMPEVDVVLSFEMRGGGGPSIMFETNDRNGWVVRAFQDFAPHPFANSLSYEVYERMPRDTDFTPFREAGVQGLNFAAIDNAHIYHQVYDVPENVSPSTLQHHGSNALAGLRHLGDADLTSVDDANVVFFSVPGLGFFVYDRIWVVPIAVLLVVSFALLLLAGRRAGVRGTRVGLGGLVLVAGGGLAYLAASAAFDWLVGFHPEYGALQGSAFHSEGWYVLAIVFTVLLVLSGTAVLVRRWIAPLELAVGALVLPVLAAVVASFVAPLGAMNLQWPTLAGILSVTVMALLGRRASGLVGWVVFLALAVPVFLFLQPVFELLWLAMSLELAGGLAAIAAVGFFLSMPLLTSLQMPNRWWAPLTFTLLAGATLGAGIVTAGPSAEAPAPSTLVYAYEHGTESAVWATMSEGRAWARQRVGGTFDATRSLEGFAYPPGPVPVAQARVLLVEPPLVDVVEDTVVGGTRRVVLEVRSVIGAELLAFQMGGDTRLTAINGQPLSNVEELRWMSHWGEPDGSLVLDLTMPPASPIDVHVVEHLLRPEELLGRDAFRRPPELAPDIERLSDRALFRYSVAAFADPRFPDRGLDRPDPAADSASAAEPDSSAAPADTSAVADTTAPTDTTPVHDTTAILDTTTAGSRP